MSRAFIFALVFFIILGSCTTTNMLRTVGTAQERTSTVLEGEVYIRDFLFYKDFADNRYALTFLIREFSYPQQDSKYFLDIQYYGKEWVFQNSFRVKIDDMVFSAYDDNPIRETTGSGIIEALSVELSNEDVGAILNAEEIAIEFFGVHEVDEAMIEQIKSFITGDL